ncbi:MAG: hypothetical protein D6730_07315 [Bacteroidetes bacterium]|nr:MAG: hypothetical protein D6730_07315 [Bacteroidota bacterium]
MSELQRNLATFQNLCVIACADGKINEGVMSLLADMALALGLPPTEFWMRIIRAPYLDFIIPEDEEERLRELRMVILMMISDGQISETEYKGCMLLAERMNISSEYVDEHIAYYQNKQEERLKKMAIYGNLYIVAAADGEISEEEAIFLENAASSLGLTQEEAEHIHTHYRDMELMVPDGEEERYYALRNIVLMMVVDEEIETAEYQLCVAFAEKIGMSRQEVNELITEYRQKPQEYTRPPEVEMSNIDVYLDVFNSFNRISLPASELAGRIAEIVRSREVGPPLPLNPIERKAFYDFVWLYVVRAMEICPTQAFALHEQLSRVAASGNFRPLQDYLLNLEQTHGQSPIPIWRMSTEEVRQDIQAFFEQDPS